MGRKKPPEDHVNHERWLVSYADFITLLFAFFVVMWSISELDKRKMMKVKQSIQFGLANRLEGEDKDPFRFFDMQAHSPFGDLDETPTNSKRAKDSDGGETDNSAKGAPSFKKVLHDRPNAMQRHLSQLKRQVQAILIAQGLRGNKLGIEIELTDDGLRIRIPGQVIFTPKSANLRSDTWEVLQDIAEVVKQSPLPARVDGHEARVNAADKGTNDWELSLMRATRLLRFIVKRGSIDPKRIIAAGYGAHRPVKEGNSDEANFANERYEIIILAQSDYTEGYMVKTKE